MKMYTIVNQSKYILEVELIKNIEDAGDEFFTEEEIVEMMGGEQSWVGSKNFLTNRMKEDVALLKKELVASGKKTILIRDVELVEALSQSYGSITQYCKGLRRVGNRLFLHEKKETDGPKKAHVQQLVNAVSRTVNKDKKVVFNLTYIALDRSGAVELCKKLVSWEDLIWEGTYPVASEADKAAMKQIWDNPNIFDEVVDQN